jgi:hypothetical protein
VRIAVRALGDMRNGALLHSPPSITCTYPPIIPTIPLTSLPAL